MAAARGDLRERRRPASQDRDRLPLPATAALLGDVLARHRAGPARPPASTSSCAPSSRSTAAVALPSIFELARFEADHLGDPGADLDATIAQAQAALAARPTIFAEDTLGWALRGAGRPADALPHVLAATRLGTEDALLWYHLAAVEADLGRSADAREPPHQARSQHQPAPERPRPARGTRRSPTRLGVIR